MDATTEALEEAPDLGPVVALSIRRFFAERHNRDAIAALRRAGLRWEEGLRRSSAGHLAGKTFVLTGTLLTMSRKEATERIQSQGGKVTGSVSAKADYVVAGADPGAKLAKAEALRIPVLDENGLLELLKGSTPCNA